jgi:hypothetical protein
MTPQQLKIIEALQGEEIYFRDFGAVGIKDNTLVDCGKVIFKITNATFKEVWDAYLMTEYGTTEVQE